MKFANLLIVIASLATAAHASELAIPLAPVKPLGNVEATASADAADPVESIEPVNTIRAVESVASVAPLHPGPAFTPDEAERALEEHHSGLFHWRINPLMNPDGALRREHQRTNANGVDLNRNFETPGSSTDIALAYWRDKTRGNSRRYPGPYPLSEPETNWLYQEIRDFKPDVVISVHAPYSLVDFDAPDRNKAPQQIGHLYKNLMGTYPGSLGNYAGIHLGVPVVTLELPHAGIMPSRRQISNLWTDLVRWLLHNT